MKETERIHRLLQYEIGALRQQQMEIEKELEQLGTEQKGIVIKSIQGKQYYYEQWKKNGKLISRSLGRVRPGVIYEEEKRIARRKELMAKWKEQEFLLKELEQTGNVLNQKRKGEKILQDYSFEVYWKDEITAVVRVRGARVEIAKYCEHPVKQIFAAKRITRHQLNRILELRCIERGRPDIQQILNHLGLQEYNPYEIVRKTHGVSYNDYIWFRFPGENLTAKDVLVRTV